jgi:hypothetical protein
VSSKDLTLKSNDLPSLFEEVTFHGTSLEIPDDFPMERWQNLMHVLKVMHKGVTWWIGDALNRGEQIYGETYTQAYEATGRSKSTLGSAKWVAAVFPPEKRRDDLDFSHHAEVASLMRDHEPVVNQILDMAIRDDLTVSKVRLEAKAARIAVGLDTDRSDGNWGLPPPIEVMELTNQWTGEFYEVKPYPEWLPDLLIIVQDLATAGTDYSVLREVKEQAIEFAKEHDLPYKDTYKPSYVDE